MTQTELKPCPFCGGIAQIDNRDTCVIVSCQNEDCYFTPELMFTYHNQELRDETEKAAIEAWNRRAPDLAPLDELGNWLSVEIAEQIEHCNYGNQDLLWKVERELKRIVEKYQTRNGA